MTNYTNYTIAFICSSIPVGIPVTGLTSVPPGVTWGFPWVPEMFVLAHMIQDILEWQMEARRDILNIHVCIWAILVLVLSKLGV